MGHAVIVSVYVRVQNLAFKAKKVSIIIGIIVFYLAKCTILNFA